MIFFIVIVTTIAVITCTIWACAQKNYSCLSSSYVSPVAPLSMHLCLSVPSRFPFSSTTTTTTSFDSSRHLCSAFCHTRIPIHTSGGTATNTYASTTQPYSTLYTRYIFTLCGDIRWRSVSKLKWGEDLNGVTFSREDNSEAYRWLQSHSSFAHLGGDLRKRWLL